MTKERLLALSTRWFRLLLKLYPEDFRDEMGEALVETYRDRARAALGRGGRVSVLWVWLRALGDSLRNGPGERARPAVKWRRSGNWGRDMELAVRRVVRSPVFVLSMVGTLTVGLGAFAVVYTVVQKVLVAPLPYRHPGDLYYVWRDYTKYFDLNRGWLGGPDVAELQKAGGVIEGAAGLLRQRMTLSGGGAGEPTEIGVMVTSPELFDLLGVRPALGRVFRPEETGEGRPPLLVLTHGLWNRLGADRSIVGSEVRLNGQPYTVIGVLGRDFQFVRNASLGPPQKADAYTTFSVDLATTNPGSGSYAGLMRARPGTSPESVAAAVDAVGRLVDERDHASRGLRLYPVSLQEDLLSGVRPALTVLGAAGLFLVLVLLVNLGTLLLTRAAQREQEFAVSRALGANPIALMRATLLEGMLLGMLGGAGAALAAVWGTRMLVRLAPPDLPRLETIAVDWQIALVVVGIGALLGLFAALAPAVWSTRTKLSSLLHSASVRGGGGHGRLRRGMVVVQVALSLVLLTAGGLVVRSFDRLLRAEPGFEPAGVLTLRVPVSRTRFPEDADVNSVHERIEQELTALPGVSSVGATLALPLSAGANQTRVGFPGAPGNTGDEDRDNPLIDYLTVRPGYFETLGIPILQGRGFEKTTPGGAREVVIDRLLAAQFFPNANPLGYRMQWGNDTVTVVGVAEHARLYDVHRDDRPQLYLRNDQFTFSTLSFALRSQRPPMALVPDVRAAIRRVDPELALAEVRPMEELVGESLRQQRLSAVLIGGFSLGALLLAAMGLFGVVSGSVTRRRHELAVRLALGADHGRVLRLVMGEGAALIALGLLLGVPGIYFAGQLIRGTLVGVSPFDPLTLVAVALGLGTVAVGACYLPARRVTRIEPARSLRQER